MLSKAPTVDDAMFDKGYEQVLNYSCRGSFHLNKTKVFQKKKKILNCIYFGIYDFTAVGQTY